MALRTSARPGLTLAARQEWQTKLDAATAALKVHVKEFLDRRAAIKQLIEDARKLPGGGNTLFLHVDDKVHGRSG